LALVLALVQRCSTSAPVHRTLSDGPPLNDVPGKTSLDQGQDQGQDQAGPVRNRVGPSYTPGEVIGSVRSATGSVTVNTAPPSGRLRAAIFPPCSRMIA
jgi:hypothetical protein